MAEGETSDCLCSLFLRTLEIRRPFVIKSFVLCKFLLNLVRVTGKFSSIKVLKVAQKALQLMLTSWDEKTSCHLWLFNDSLNLAILSVVNLRIGLLTVAIFFFAKGI
jgi:hypothetical protein